MSFFFIVFETLANSLGGYSFAAPRSRPVYVPLSNGRIAIFYHLNYYLSFPAFVMPDFMSTACD